MANSLLERLIRVVTTHVGQNLVVGRFKLRRLTVLVEPTPCRTLPEVAQSLAVLAGLRVADLCGFVLGARAIPPHKRESRLLRLKGFESADVLEVVSRLVYRSHLLPPLGELLRKNAVLSVDGLSRLMDRERGKTRAGLIPDNLKLPVPPRGVRQARLADGTRIRAVRTAGELKKLGSDLGNCLGSTAINGYLDGRYTVNALIGSDGKAIGCFEIDIANRITQAKARRNEELPAELAHVLADFLAELGFNERELRRRVLTASQQQLAQVNDDAAALEFGRRVAALAIPG